MYVSTIIFYTQYESAFVPQRLQNYELPRQYKKASTVYIINYFIFVSTQYPTQRNGHTEIITDDRGHLNDPRLRSARSPWGDYLSTWQRPQKEIQLKVKTKLMTQQFQPPLVLSPALRQLSQGNEDQSSHAASGTPTASSKPQRSTPTGDQQEGSNQASCHTPQQVASSQASYSVSQSSQRAHSASTSRRRYSSRGTSSKGTSRAHSIVYLPLVHSLHSLDLEASGIGPADASRVYTCLITTIFFSTIFLSPWIIQCGKSTFTDFIHMKN